MSKLKIEQFVERQFGIKLTKQQLEFIAIIAANPDKKIAIHTTGRSAGKTMAYKAAIAYLQDGLKKAPGKYPVELYVKGKLVHAGNATIKTSVTEPFTVVFDEAIDQLNTDLIRDPEIEKMVRSHNR